VETNGAIDFFDRARRVAVALLLAAGAAAVIGSALDWAVLERCPEIVPGSTFEEDQLEEPPPCPVRGTDTTEGKAVVVAGFVTLAAAILLTIKVRNSFAWLALLSSAITGSFAVAAYRGIGDANSSISRRLGLIDAYEPGIGLTLVAVAGILGVLAAAGGIAATPRTD
jgi:hypothetical protein